MANDSSDQNDSAVTFEELFNLDDLQRMQDAFARSAGVASLITRPDGTPITRPTGFCRLCRDIIRKTERGRQNCFASDAALGRHDPEGPTIRPCLSGGLWDAGASITVGGQHVASWLIGQVRNERQDQERMLAYADEIGADREEFLAALNEVPYMSAEQFKAVSDALFLLANEISRKAYQNLELSRLLRQREADEAALRSSEGRFRTIFNSVSDLIFIHSWPDGRIVDVNQRACEAFGYTREELLDIPVDSLSAGFAPYDQASAMELMRKAHEGAPQVAEWLSKAHDGHLFWVEASTRRAVLQGREHILVSCRDIGERKETEELLSRERLFTDAVIDSVPGLLYLYDDQGRLLRWNKMHEDLTGYSGEELSRMRLTDWYKGDPGTIERINKAIERVMREGSASEEAELQTKSGEKIPFYLTAVRLDLAGRTYFTGIGIDIRERRKSEQRLADKEALLQAMLRNLPFDFWARDLNQRIILQSTESMRLWGDLGVDEKAEQRIDSGYRQHWRATNERVLAGEVVAEDVEYVTPGGVPRLYHSLVAPIHGGLGGERVLGIMGINIDTTERTRAEAALRESEEMYRSLFENMLNGFAYCQMHFDPAGKAVDFTYLSVNAAFEKLTGLRTVVGRKVSEVIPGIQESDPALLETYGRVALTGRAERFEVYVASLKMWFAISLFSPKRGHFVAVFDVITERVRAEAALHESRRVLASIVDTVPQSIFWKDRESVYLGCNKAFARDMGLADPQNVVGKNDFDLTRREEAEAFRSDDREVMGSRIGKLSYIEQLTLQDGSQLWLETSKLPLLDDAGLAVGVVGIYEDVTERKRAAEALEHSKLMADAANLAKSEFLANMSHEIRTPLNGVLGMIDLLKHTGLAHDQSDFVTKADEAARRLLSLLNDILDFSRIEAGRMVLNRNAFSLADVFRTVSNVLGVPAAKKDLELTLQIDPSVPPVLLGDDARLRQVLFNIVGNAVKFTRQGFVRVEAWRIPREGDEAVARLCIRVSDTGEGIADNKVRHVFERFTQSDSSYTRQHEGAGLGLAIVKRIVDLMDGSITVDTEVGRGTDIYLTLDLGVGIADAIERKAEPAPDRLAPLRVLLAEDEPIGQMALTVQLRQLGHSVTAVANGREVLDALAGAEYDCVLMDIQMPEMDGVEATRRIRGMAGPKSRLPVIALTAYVMEGDREKFLAAGMDGHVGKPVQVEQLVQELARVLAHAPVHTPDKRGRGDGRQGS